MSLTRVVISSERHAGRISRQLFGANHVYAARGYGMWDASRHRPYPRFVAQVRDAGISALRYPAGTAGNLFRWRDAIGPVHRRRLGPVFRATTFPYFGPDEFGALLDEIGAVGSIVVNFATLNAVDAADWVEYMTAPLGANPGGGTPWAQLRAEGGHPEPYDVPHWEVANEPWHPEQYYWMAGHSERSMDELYAFGGTTTFTEAPVVGYENHDPNAGLGDGSTGQVRYAPYPPVVPGSQTLYVDGRAWASVADLSSARPSDAVYEFDPGSGEIRFGDGEHGCIPRPEASITISYDSGPHDGFVDFYREMKAVNPDIKVYSSLHNETFLKLMGADNAYDGVVQHPYARSSVTRSNGEPLLPDNLPIEEYRHRFLTSMTEELAAEVAKTQRDIRAYAGHRSGDVTVAITEYGAIDTPAEAKHYHRSLDEGLFDAELLRRLVELDSSPAIVLAMRHLLTSYVFEEAPPEAFGGGNAMISGPGPETEPQAQAHVFSLLTSMTGTKRLTSKVIAPPTRLLGTGQQVDLLTALATEDADSLYLVVINLSVGEDVQTRVEPGVPHRSQVEVWTVTGPSFLSFNTREEPDNVTLSKRVDHVASGAFDYTFPAHSVTGIRLTRPTLRP